MLTTEEIKDRIHIMLDSKAIIANNGLNPNKALGQNFLIDETAIKRIVELCRCDDSPVFEIGPGLGALTEELLKHAQKVCAVEIDANMVQLLSANLGNNPKLSLVNCDFLKYPVERIKDEFSCGSFIVAANLPYYITAPICQRLFDSELNISRMVLMMQEEAADRFTAAPGAKNYVPLSVIAQQLFDISVGLKLSPASYYPAPEVNSVVLVFERSNRFTPKDFSKVVKAAFAMRRKTLFNNLQSIADKAAVLHIIESAGLSPSVRAESLSPSDFVSLSKAYDELIK